MAVKKPSTRNPGTIRETRKIISPLMIKIKSPKVRIVNGKVKISKIGFNKVLTIPNTTETIKAVKNPSTYTPFKIYAVTNTAKAFISRLIINCIILFYVIFISFFIYFTKFLFIFVQMDKFYRVSQIFGDFCFIHGINI